MQVGTRYGDGPRVPWLFCLFVFCVLKPGRERKTAAIPGTPRSVSEGLRGGGARPLAATCGGAGSKQLPCASPLGGALRGMQLFRAGVLMPGQFSAPGADAHTKYRSNSQAPRESAGRCCTCEGRPCTRDVFSGRPSRGHPLSPRHGRSHPV